MGRWRVSWDNGHSCGTFPQVFDSQREAEAWARNWEREMVAIEPDAKGRREAREAYQWEVDEEETPEEGEEHEDPIRDGWVDKNGRP